MRGLHPAWNALAEAVGGEYHRFPRGDGVRVTTPVGPWRIIFTDYRTDVAGDYYPHTIITANYVTTHDLRFGIHHATLLSPLGHLLGLQDIQVGDSAFDAAYVVKANDVAAVRALLSYAELRRLLLEQPKLHLSVMDHEGLITRRWTPEAGRSAHDFRSDVDVLYCHIEEDIPDAERLLGLHNLFVGMLHGLVRIGAATKDDPAASQTSESS